MIAANYGEDLIFTTDVLYAYDALEKARTELAEAQKSLDAYDGSQGWSPEFLEQLQTNVDRMEWYISDLEEYLNEISEDGVVGLEVVML